MLKAQYGISEADYASMLEAQNSTCAICQRPPNAGTSLCVDHCHASGRIRGLLCHACNKGIGFMRDDVKRLEAALDYLRQPPRLF